MLCSKIDKAYGFYVYNTLWKKKIVCVCVEKSKTAY